MALEIKNGDFLVIGDAEYPIQGSEKWPLAGLGALNFGSFQTVSGEIIRYKSDDTTENIALDLSVMDLMPVSSENLNALPEIASPHKVKKTYFSDNSDLWMLIVQDDEAT